MTMTTHERPGVYSAYDASAVVSGSGGGKGVGLAALCTGAAAGEAVRITRYEDAVSAFGSGEEICELIRLLLLNGAAAVDAVPAADESGYAAAFAALEAVEDSFLLRNYGAKRGELYKPDSMNIGGGEEKQAPQGDMPKMPQGNFSAFPARGEAADDAASDGFSPSGGAPQMPKGFDPSQFSSFSQETEGQKENENRFARGGGFGGFAGFGSGGANLN